MTLEIVPKQTGFFKTRDGADLYYEIRGQGEPVIFVYGIACVLNHWHHQLTYFSHRNRAYAFDLRGHAASTSPTPEKLTVQGMAEDLLELMDHWNLSSAHLVGHSFGVPVVLQAYGLAPDRVKSLTFINGFAKNPIKGMFGLDVVEPFFHLAKGAYYKNRGLFNLAWKSAVGNPLSILISGLAGGFNLKVTQLKDIEIYARGVTQMSLDHFLPLFEDMMSFDGSPIADSIATPTLIMTGDRDFVTPFRFQEELHHAIPGSQFVRIPYGSHCCQLDFPDYVNLKLEQFLSKI